MRMALRADTSDIIGTGDVMRQVAITQHLLGLGVYVFLVGNTSAPKWLSNCVSKESELVRVVGPRVTLRQNCSRPSSSKLCLWTPIKCQTAFLAPKIGAELGL